MSERRCARCGCFLSGYSVGRGWTMCHACEPTIKAYEPGPGTSRTARGCKTHGFTDFDLDRRECRICRRAAARIRKQRERDKRNAEKRKGQ